MRTMLEEDIRSFWDADAATYDAATGHAPHTDRQRNAWIATLQRLLPEPPARVLDAGAGTGFLSLMAAALGHEVTALDLSENMLARLRLKAAESGVDVATVTAPAQEPPPGPFDVVIERHLVWTLPDPEGTLAAWHRVAAAGRLVLFETLWGRAAGPVDRSRAWLRSRIGHALGRGHDHHAPYPEGTQKLPFAGGTPPRALVAVATRAGWNVRSVEPLPEIARANAAASPFPEWLLGSTPNFAILADG